MSPKLRKVINISKPTYDRLEKLKKVRKDEIKQVYFSFDEFLVFLMNLYESNLISRNPVPSIYDLQEIG